jgi:UrcA family protein
MIGKFAILTGSMAAAAAALGLAAATASHAQPYYDDGYYGYDAPPPVGEIVVRPQRYPERTYNGIPVERVYASRVVDASDLDLNTPWGARVLYDRVEDAAADACHELDMQWTRGLYPLESDVDCRARAVRRAMHAAPIGVAANSYYRGY